MNTPRKLLFKKHETAESKLDAIRQNVLNDFIQNRSGAPLEPQSNNPHFDSLVLLWHSLRWHLTRLGGAWAAIFLFSLLDRTPGIPSQGTSDLRQPVVQAWAEHQRQLASWMADPFSNTTDLRDVPASRDNRRRSQISRAQVTC
jgi:hypothetical protein